MSNSFAKSWPTLWNPMDCSLLGSSVYGIYQARILEWVTISFSRISSQPRDWTQVSCIPCIGRQIPDHWATREAPIKKYWRLNEVILVGPNLVWLMSLQKEEIRTLRLRGNLTRTQQEDGLLQAQEKGHWRIQTFPCLDFGLKPLTSRCTKRLTQNGS